MKNKVLLPNFYGIFEVKSATKNRIRIEIDKLKNNEEEIERLKENLKKIKTPNIYMLGSRTDVSEFLGSFDVFVLPSKMEALGTALLEAQSCGVPCIGSDAGGIGEAINSGETGLLFKNGDKESLKAALKMLIEDAALRAKFSANAREFIVRNFSIETMVAQTEAMYEAL